MDETGWNLYSRQFAVEFDLPEVNTPVKTLIIASTPRCGSHMLGHSVIETGSLGVPFEYCNSVNIQAWKNRLQTKNTLETLRKVMKFRTTKNGIFSIKLHFEHTHEFSSFKDLLNFFPDPHFVLIEREDALMQAISFAKAKQTGVWISGQTGNGRDSSYDFNLVDVCLQTIIKERSSWHYELAKHGCHSMHIEFKDVYLNLTEQIIRISKFLGVHLEPSRIPKTPPTRKQSSSNEGTIWKEKFLKDVFLNDIERKIPVRRKENLFWKFKTILSKLR